MKERIVKALDDLVPIHYIEAPENDDVFPKAIYQFLNEGYVLTLDDNQQGKSKIVEVNLFSFGDLDLLSDNVEEALKAEFEYCFLLKKREIKQDDLFRNIMEFEIYL